MHLLYISRERLFQEVFSKLKWMVWIFHTDLLGCVNVKSQLMRLVRLLQEQIKSFIINTTAKANDTTDILQTFR